MSQVFQDILSSDEFREEYFVTEFQARLSDMLDQKGVSRAELARKLNVSRARVTQIFSDDAKNFTLRLLFRSFWALEEEPIILRKSEYDDLKRSAEQVVAEADNSLKNSRKKVPEGITSALIGELLRANAMFDGGQTERTGRKNDSARDWAEASPNVVPFRERARA